jgi:hypothetical protein
MVYFFSKGSLELHAYCDYDWAGNPDDQRSTTRFCIFLRSNLISWAAKKQPTVSRSSTEVEYRSMAFATTELFWVCMLLQELRIALLIPPCLWCDNSGALTLASNPVYQVMCKF